MTDEIEATLRELYGIGTEETTSKGDE